jgi:hypothetical protein
MIRHSRFAGLAMPLAIVTAVLLMTSAAPAGDKSPRPNWKGSGTGTTKPQGGVHVDAFSGRSTHLGRFTGEGFHILNPLDLTFQGQATWTAANGDTLELRYAGQVFLTGDADFPFGFVATLDAVGGSGRFSDARGSAVMTGAFTGVPGDLYFAFEGTLDLHGE